MSCFRAEESLDMVGGGLVVLMEVELFVAFLNGNTDGLTIRS